MDLHTYDKKTNFEVPFDILNLEKKIKEKKVIDTFDNIKLNVESNKFLKDMLLNLNSFDSINQFYILDILYMCSFIITEDFLNELELQLLDMKTGFCEQGKTIRLIQLIKAFSN